ncbi:transmembrane protein 39A isoform X2 [Fukomys damarensis]|uniref:transmembrane protein 39A isoform X2 n=1 Tax=Fukomys damarensis TaxID=885580 RepID=UPI00053FF5DB|nr:transmembrane protein 39A isoform X2 [Fukomys damarensis]
MPGGRRGPSRQQLSRSALPSLQTLVGGGCGNGTGLRNRNGSAIGLPVPPITALITPGPVRHCQIPDLPVDGSLLFEFLFFIYLLVALFIQYINIYKTVWWYPYNHPASCTSLNFHLIDYHLAAFITVMLARRLVWALISEATKAGAASMVHYMVLISARLVLLTLCGWVLCWTLVNLFRSHSVLNLLFLGYPFGVYVPLCCFHQDSRAHLLLTDYNYVVQHQAVEESASTVGGLAKSKDFLSLLLESLKEQFNNATPIPTHSCPLSPDLIRNEVECLKADFNHRIKEVLFNSLFSAYYVAFLPLCFVKPGWWSSAASGVHLYRSWLADRAPSTMTCAGHVSTLSWCGSMLLSCSPHNCCHPNTVICSTNQLHTWASGRSWNTGPIAMLHSTFGQKIQYGLKGCWCGTADVYIEPWGLTTWQCLQMCPMPAFISCFIVH